MQFVANHAKTFLTLGGGLFVSGGVPQYFGGTILHNYNGTVTNSSDSQNLGIGLITLGGACQIIGTAICAGTYYAVRHSAKSGTSDDTHLLKQRQQGVVDPLISESVTFSEGYGTPQDPDTVPKLAVHTEGTPKDNQANSSLFDSDASSTIVSEELSLNQKPPSATLPRNNETLQGATQSTEASLESQ